MINVNDFLKEKGYKVPPEVTPKPTKKARGATGISVEEFLKEKGYEVPPKPARETKGARGISVEDFLKEKGYIGKEKETKPLVTTEPKTGLEITFAEDLDKKRVGIFEQVKNFFNPKPIRAIRNNNPGNLKSGSPLHDVLALQNPDGTPKTDDEGHLIFPNMQVGWIAAYNDLDAKMLGYTGNELLANKAGKGVTIADLNQAYATDKNWKYGVVSIYNKLTGEKATTKTDVSTLDRDALQLAVLTQEGFLLPEMDYKLYTNLIKMGITEPERFKEEIPIPAQRQIFKGEEPTMPESYLEERHFEKKPKIEEGLYNNLLDKGIEDPESFVNHLPIETQRNILKRIGYTGKTLTDEEKKKLNGVVESAKEAFEAKKITPDEFIVEILKATDGLYEKNISALPDKIEKPVKKVYDFVSNGIKGITGLIYSLPEKGSTLLLNQAELASTKPKFSVLDLVFPWRYGYRSTLYKLGEKSEYDEKIADWSKDQILKNRDELKELGLTISEDASFAEKFPYGIGSGLGSLALAIGTTLITKNPSAAAIAFGGLAKADTYLSAREAGLTVERANMLSNLNFLSEASLEYIGLELFLKSAKNPLARHTMRMLTESIQEASQEFSTNFWEKIGWNERKNLLEGVGMSALIGAIVAAPVSVSVDIAERNGWIDKLESWGLSKEEARPFLNKLIADTRNGLSKTLEEEIVPMVYNKALTSSLSPTTILDFDKAFVDEFRKEVGRMATVAARKHIKFKEVKEVVPKVKEEKTRKKAPRELSIEEALKEKYKGMEIGKEAKKVPPKEVPPKVAKEKPEVKKVKPRVKPKVKSEVKPEVPKELEPLAKEARKLKATLPKEKEIKTKHKSVHELPFEKDITDISSFKSPNKKNIRYSYTEGNNQLVIRYDGNTRKFYPYFRDIETGKQTPFSEQKTLSEAKSQLIDIWNKAQATKGIKPEAKVKEKPKKALEKVKEAKKKYYEKKRKPKKTKPETKPKKTVKEAREEYRKKQKELAERRAKREEEKREKEVEKELARKKAERKAEMKRREELLAIERGEGKEAERQAIKEKESKKEKEFDERQAELIERRKNIGKMSKEEVDKLLDDERKLYDEYYGKDDEYFNKAKRGEIVGADYGISVLEDYKRRLGVSFNIPLADTIFTGRTFLGIREKAWAKAEAGKGAITLAKQITKTTPHHELIHLLWEEENFNKLKKSGLFRDLDRDAIINDITGGKKMSKEEISERLAKGFERFSEEKARGINAEKNVKGRYLRRFFSNLWNAIKDIFKAFRGEMNNVQDLYNTIYYARETGNQPIDLKISKEIQAEYKKIPMTAKQRAKISIFKRQHPEKYKEIIMGTIGKETHAGITKIEANKVISAIENKESKFTTGKRYQEDIDNLMSKMKDVKPLPELEKRVEDTKLKKKTIIYNTYKFLDSVFNQLSVASQHARDIDAMNRDETHAYEKLIAGESNRYYDKFIELKNVHKEINVILKKHKVSVGKFIFSRGVKEKEHFWQRLTMSRRAEILLAKYDKDKRMAMLAKEDGGHGDGITLWRKEGAYKLTKAEMEEVWENALPVEKELAEWYVRTSEKFLALINEVLKKLGYPQIKGIKGYSAIRRYADEITEMRDAERKIIDKKNRDKLREMEREIIELEKREKYEEAKTLKAKYFDTQREMEIRQEESPLTIIANMVNEVAGEFDWRMRKTGVNRYWSIERLDTHTGRPVNGEFFENVLADINSKAYFIAMAEYVHKINSIWNDKYFSLNFKHNYGEAKWIEIAHWAAGLRSPYRQGGTDPTERFLWKMGKNYSLSLVVGRVSTAMLQSASYATGIGYLIQNYGLDFVPHLIQTHRDLTFYPKRTNDFVEKMFPQLKDRFITPVISEVKNTIAKSKLGYSEAKIQKIATSFARFFDEIAVRPLALTAYRTELAKSGDINKAYDAGMAILDETQPMATLKDLPRILGGGDKTSVLKNLLGLLRVYSTKWTSHTIRNVFRPDKIYRMTKGGKTRKAFVATSRFAGNLIFSYLLASFLAFVIRHGRIPKKDDGRDIAEVALSPWLGIPGFGHLVPLVLHGISNFSIMGEQMVNYILWAYNAAAKAVTDKDAKSALKAGKQALKLFGSSQAFPVTQTELLFSAVLNLAKENDKDFWEFLSRLLYSESTLKEREKGKVKYDITKDLMDFGLDFDFKDLDIEFEDLEVY